MKRHISLSLILALLWASLSLSLAAPSAPSAPSASAQTALDRAAAYYAEAGAESWEDILALYAMDSLPKGLSMPEDLSPSAQVLCALALGLDPYALKGCPPYALAAAQKAGGALGDSLTEHIYAMLALKLAPARLYDKDAAMAWLVGQQTANGSFEAWGSVTEPTGLALLVLDGNPAERAAAFLLTQMTENGGFVGYPEYGTDPDSCTTASVLSGLIAASASIPDAVTAHLLSYQDESGAFRYLAGLDADPVYATPQCARVLGELAGGSVYARLAAAAPEAPPYADWADIPAWGHDYVLYALDSEWMIGDTQGRFNPGGEITRAELAMILMTLNLNADGRFGASYTDVRPGEWFAEAVRYVSENGLMEGDGNQFKPREILTREEIAFYLARGLGLMVTTPDRQPSDISAVTPAYADGVRAVFAEGIMIGGAAGVFNPKGRFTRVELAGLLNNLHA